MKKLFSTITAICILLQVFILPADATLIDWADRADDFTDTVTVYDDDSVILGVGEDFPEEEISVKKQSEAYKALLKIGIVKGDANDTPVNEKGITRAAFVQMIIRALNMSDNKISGTMFADVDQSHYAYNEIGIAFSMGIISGSNGCFRPDDIITYNEAISVLVNMLGHSVEAQARGGYPAGYIMVANRCDILRYVKIDDMGSAAYNDDLYEMLMNTARSTEYADMSGIVNNQDAVYNTGRSILEIYHKIYHLEGVIDAVGFSNILTSAKYDRDTVKMGSTLFKGKYEEQIDYLGMNCEILYRDNNGNKDIIYTSMTDNNEIIVINADDVTYQNGTYTYFDGAKSRTARLTGGNAQNVLYNGSIYTGDLTEQQAHVPEIGYVTLINNDGGGGYDVVRVDAVENLIVGFVDSDKNIVYDLERSNLYVDFNDESEDKMVTLLNSTDVEIYPTMLSKKQILSVKRSVDGSIVYGLASDKKVSGVIEEVTSEGGCNVIIIEGNKYKSTAFCSAQYSKILKPNTAVTLYFDAMNHVAYVDEGIGDEDTGMKYAYVIDTKVESGMDGKVQIKVLNQDGTITIDGLSENCIIDKARIKSTAQQLDAINQGLNIGRVIRLVKNEDNLINEIDTLYYNSLGEEEKSTLYVRYDPNLITTEEWSGALTNENTNKKLFHKGTDDDSGMFSESIHWTKKDTVIFVVYADEGLSEEDRYRVNVNNSPWGNDTYASPLVYQSSEGYVADVIVDYHTESYDPAAVKISSSTLYVVTKVTDAYVDSEPIKCLYVTRDGSSIQKIYIEEQDFNTRTSPPIEKGDIVRFDLISEDKVFRNNIITLYDYSEDVQTNSSSKGGYNDQFRRRSAYVYDVDGNYVALYDTDNINAMAVLNDDNYVLSSELTVNDISSVKMYKVSQDNSGNITVKTATVKDLQPYKTVGTNATRVYYRKNYMLLTHMYIIDRD